VEVIHIIHQAHAHRHQAVHPHVTQAMVYVVIPIRKDVAVVNVLIILHHIILPHITLTINAIVNVLHL
jgi:hypothetical protein